MKTAAFTTACSLGGTTFTSCSTLSTACNRRAFSASLRTAPQFLRAELDLVPGVPPGEDARENAPLRYYVPRPVETYEDRGFSTVLPKTWEGEIDTIGRADIPPLTKKEDEYLPVDSVSTGAFLQYAQMMKAEREESLRKLAEKSQIEQTGRPTCGEKEGREFVSNARDILVDGVKAVEYWGVPNGPVPRLFGGPGA